MEANAGLVAGSHIRNELVVILADHEPKPTNKFNAGQCAICGDAIESASDDEFFVACNECAFPVCRPCYDYERKEGNQSCPHCKTRYRRLRGSSRVEGDEEESGVDDLENEFGFLDHDIRRSNIRDTEAMLHAKTHSGTPTNDEDLASNHISLPPPPQVPLLRNGSVGSDNPSVSADRRAIMVPPAQSGGVFAGNRDGTDEVSHSSIAWKDRVESWSRRERQEKMHMQMTERGQFSVKRYDDDSGPDLPSLDKARQPLSRKNPIASSLINPYRIVIILRLLVIGFFFRYRIMNPVHDAYGLWLISVICEIWFGISWILDQFPKWLPVNRETYLDRLSLRFEPEGQPSQLTPVDIYVSTVDPSKEPPLVTANTVLSILSVDYPVEKVSCYVSDDGAAMLTFEVLAVYTSDFARKWVPFCKKFEIEPRAPEVYFSQKLDYLKDKVQPTFVKERRAMKREYEEFKVRVNAAVARSLKMPEEGWTMRDGTPWPANNARDHPAMIQVFLGQSGSRDVDGKQLPRLVYVSREKRPGFNHHKKAGAMNALVRVSAILSNAPYLLNLDCDHYINNSKAVREAMCFLMDPTVGKRCCYVQFPQRFDGIDRNDRYANHNTVFFDINMKGLDGVQGPAYVGTGCVFRRQALYGYYPPPKLTEENKDPGWVQRCCGPRKQTRRMPFSKRPAKKKNVSSKKGRKILRSETDAPAFNLEDIEEGVESEELNLIPRSLINLEKRYGQSPVFIQSSRQEKGGVVLGAEGKPMLKEAVHVISCGYEDKTEWGKEIGWIYGSVTEDILTGFKMHCRGWRSIYCMPKRPAFKGSAPINLTDRLHQVLRWALGSVEILLSRHCPLWYGYGGGQLKCLERLAYINTTVYPLTSLPLVAYCSLPAVCLLTGRFWYMGVMIYWEFYAHTRILHSRKHWTLSWLAISNFESLWFISLFLSIFATGILEMRWSNVGIDEWWRNEQFWVIGGVSSHLFALFQGLLKVLGGVETNFTVTSKAGEDETFGELYAFKWTALLIPPTTLLVVNLVGVVAGISDAINNGYQSWGPLFGKLFFAFWVIVHLYPFLKGLMGRQNRTPTIVIVWSILLASIFSLLWVRIDPFLQQTTGPNLESCGVNC